MREYIVERVYETAQYIVDTGATVRACAARFKISKTTVHKDMRERLPELNSNLAREVNRVLEINKADRHIRGGQATKLKYHPAEEA